MTNDTPAAPAPEPVAWASMLNGNVMQATHQQWRAQSWANHGGDVRPLYLHPAPVAAPAPDVDAILKIAVNAGADRMDPFFAALRAAVEQLYAEAQMTALHREAANQAVERARRAEDNYQGAMLDLKRAERERDKLRALLAETRALFVRVITVMRDAARHLPPTAPVNMPEAEAAMNAVIDLLARIDAAMESSGPSREGLSTTKESQHGEGQEGR